MKVILMHPVGLSGTGMPAAARYTGQKSLYHYVHGPDGKPLHGTIDFSVYEMDIPETITRTIQATVDPTKLHFVTGVTHPLAYDRLPSYGIPLTPVRGTKHYWRDMPTIHAFAVHTQTGVVKNLPSAVIQYSATSGNILADISHVEGALMSPIKEWNIIFQVTGTLID